MVPDGAAARGIAGGTVVTGPEQRFVDEFAQTIVISILGVAAR
jgi:hypothetical protein